MWPFVVAGDKKPRSKAPEALRAFNISAARLLPLVDDVLRRARNNERPNYIRSFGTPLMFAAWVAQDRNECETMAYGETSKSVTNNSMRRELWGTMG